VIVLYYITVLLSIDLAGTGEPSQRGRYVRVPDSSTQNQGAKFKLPETSPEEFFNWKTKHFGVKH